MRRFPLRMPKTPHAPTDRLVPVSRCGCKTCEAARAEDEATHWGRVGELLGLEDEDTPTPPRHE